MREINETDTDTANATTSEYAVVARMNELGISRPALIELTGHQEAIKKMMHGMKITTTIANRICQSLDCVYDDLFITVYGGNHFGYAVPKGENDGDDNDTIDANEQPSQSPDKSTVKLIFKPTHRPAVQSTCPVCGSLSTRFANVHDVDMCVRCANIPRCADCLRPAYTLYVVDGGRLCCPQCESVRKKEQKEMEISK